MMTAPRQADSTQPFLQTALRSNYQGSTLLVLQACVSIKCDSTYVMSSDPMGFTVLLAYRNCRRTLQGLHHKDLQRQHAVLHSGSVTAAAAAGANAAGIGYQDLDSFPYTRAVIDEAMRCDPLACDDLLQHRCKRVYISKAAEICQWRAPSTGHCRQT